jgi:histidine phosphotransferase ChpT
VRENRCQRNLTGKDNHLARMFKGHRDAPVEFGLHLPKAPIGLAWVAYQHAGFQKFRHHRSAQKVFRMNEATGLEIAALVGSRICHDLISPIGAIGNGVELLLPQGSDNGGPELMLIADSALNANARIRFFRLAFGLPGLDQSVGREEIAGILQDLWRAGRIRISFEAPQDLSRRDAKLIFLAILCLETALAYGGQISVRREGERWHVEGRAERMKIEPALWSCLADAVPDTDVGPAHVQFLLIPAELKRQHRRMTSEVGDTRVAFSF